MRSCTGSVHRVRGKVGVWKWSGACGPGAAAAEPNTRHYGGAAGDGDARRAAGLGAAAAGTSSVSWRYPASHRNPALSSLHQSSESLTDQCGLNNVLYRERNGQGLVFLIGTCEQNLKIVFCSCCSRRGLQILEVVPSPFSDVECLPHH